MSSAADGSTLSARRWPRALLILAGLALLVALWLELWVQRSDAFWLDESWTGAIVGQRSWIDTFHEIYWDVNAPLYYLLMHLWQAVFGLSDPALRAPSLILATLTPLALAFVAVRSLPRAESLTWAALTALWFPGLCFAQEARGYSLLLFVSALQTLAFIRLLERPDIGRAAIWAGLCATAILTHYDALLICAIQGVIYLGVHRLKAVRTWPATLLFLPAFGWLLFHLPTIRAFTRPDIAWYTPLRPSQLWAVIGYVAGREPQLWALAFIATGALTLRFAWPGRGRTEQGQAAAWIAAFAAIAGAVVLVVIGFFRPSFTYRYLTPFAPGLLLSFVLIVRLLGARRAPVAFAALIIAFAALSGWQLEHKHFRMAPRRYNFERASARLAQARPTRLVFLWDHPVDPVLHVEQLAALGGFFLHREGVPMPIDAVILKRGEDPNVRLLSEAAPKGSAILWLYDKWVQGTAANRFAPAIAQHDPAWRCRQDGGGRFGVLSCTRP